MELVEYAPSTANQTAPVQTIALPNETTRPTAAPFNIMDSGNATSNGYLSRSADGSILVIPGYNGIAGDTSIANSNSTTINRVIGTVGPDGVVATSIAGTWNNGTNFRSVATVDGSNFWTGGSNGITALTTTGGAGTTLVGSNARVANIFNSQLYVSSSSSTFNGAGSNLGIWMVGTGTPTTALPATPTTELVNVINTATGSSPYDFAVSPDGLTIYIADDRGTAAGGIQKWTSTTGAAGSFTLAYTLGTGVTNVGARGLTVDFSGANPVIIATSAEAASNRIFRIEDTGAASTATTLATAPTGKIFRGIDFAPQSLTDTTPPQVTSIDDGDADNSVLVSEVMTYTINFNEDIDGSSITSADFENAGTATITIGTVNEVSERIYSFTVTPTSVGTVQLRVKSNAVIQDLAGNSLVVPVSDNDTVTVSTSDVLAPTVLSIDDGDSDDVILTNTMLTYTVVFSEDINSSTVSSADFDNEGTAAISIGTITEVTPGTFSVQVTPTSSGTLKLRIPSGAVIADVAGNNLVVPVSDVETITVNDPDVTPPQVLSITDNSVGGSVPQNMPITYTITFNEPIDNTTVALEDFVNAGTATATLGSLVRVSSTVYTVQITPRTTGTVLLSIPTGAVISDLSGNSLSVPVQDDTTVNVTAITALTAGDIAFTGMRTDDADSFSFVLLKDVIAGTNITFTDNGWGSNAFSNSSENVLTVFFSNNTPAGSHLYVNYSVTTGTFEFAGTTNSAGTLVGSLNGLSTGGESILAYQDAAPTTNTASNWIAGISTRSFVSNPTGTNQSDLPSALQLGITAIQLSSTATDVDNGSYNLASLSASAAQIRASVNDVANWTLNDDFNLVPPSTTAFTVSADVTPPTLTSMDDGDVDNSVLINTVLTYTVVFSEDIDSATVSAADFDNAGTANISIGAITETSPGVFSVSVTPTSAGSLILRIPSGAVISDIGGNNLVTPVQDNDSITVLTADVTPPTVLSINSGAPSTTVIANETITYSIVFSEPVDLATVSAADFNNAGTATINVGAIAQAVPGTLTVQVTPTSTGTLVLRIPVGATIADTSGNNLVVPVSDNDTLTVQNLEPIFISELFLNPPGTDAPNEYIELRGTPNATIPAGTYFVGVEGDASGLGDVQNIFNLSGLTFGSNGFLVLLQKDSLYTPASGSAVYTNSGTGAGWGSGSSSSVGHSGDAGATDIENASATYMIIRAAVAPTLTDDIDTVGGTQGDGTPDGAIFASWTIQDSVGVLDNSAAGDFAYGAINFINNTGGGVAISGTTVPVAFTAGFLARLGSATGSAAADWVGADIATGTAPIFALSANSSQPQLAGAAINNIGAANSFGAPTVSPQTFVINSKSLNSALVGNVVATGLVGETLTYAITNGNSSGAFSIDSATGAIHVADAKALPKIPKGSTTVNVVLTVSVTSNAAVPLTSTALMTVTLSSAGIRMNPTVNPATFALSENNKKTDGTTKVGAIKPLAAYSGQKFTFNALSGTDAASFNIDAKGGITLASGVSLNFETKPTYSFNVNVADSLDPLKVTTQAVTLNVKNLNEAPVYTLVDGAATSVAIEKGKAAIAIDENIPGNATKNGLVIATLTASDVDAGTTLALQTNAKNETIVMDKTGAFGYNTATGQISIIDETKVSFENKKAIKLSFIVTDDPIAGDPKSKAISTKLTVTVNLNDLNEAPVISSPTTFSVGENNKAGAKVGSVKAKDADTKAATKQTLTYSIFSQVDSTGGAVSLFSIDAKGGITIPTAGALNFEASPFYTLVVRVADSGTPGLFTDQTITINVLDLNEASSFALQDAFNAAATSLTISKSAINNNDKVGRLLISDVDAGAAGDYAPGAITAAVEAASKGALTYNELTGDLFVKDKTKLGKTFDLKLAIKDTATKAVTSKFTFKVNVNA